MQQIGPSLYSWSLKSRLLQLCSNKFAYTRSQCCSLSIILFAHWQQDKNSPALFLPFPWQKQPGISLLVQQNWDWSTCAVVKMQFLSKNVVCYGTATIFPYCSWHLPTHQVQPLCHSTQHNSFHWHFESTSSEKLLRDKPSYVQSTLLYSYADVQHLFLSVQQNRWQQFNKMKVFNTAVVIAKKKKVMALNPDSPNTNLRYLLVLAFPHHAICLLHSTNCSPNC